MSNIITKKKDVASFRQTENLDNVSLHKIETSSEIMNRGKHNQT